MALHHSCLSLSLFVKCGQLSSSLSILLCIEQMKKLYRLISKLLSLHFVIFVGYFDISPNNLK